MQRRAGSLTFLELIHEHRSILLLLLHKLRGQLFSAESKLRNNLSFFESELQRLLEEEHRLEILRAQDFEKKKAQGQVVFRTQERRKKYATFVRRQAYVLGCISRTQQMLTSSSI